MSIWVTSLPAERSASTTALTTAGGEPIAPASPQPFTPSGLWVHGGLGQGIGQALLEGCVYDEDGQLLSASFMDYAMPRADDVPFYQVDHSCQTPCTHNPLGVKGCGEAGAIGSPPAVVNAVVDALRSPGKDVTHIDMPLTPARVWAAMQG